MATTKRKTTRRTSRGTKRKPARSIDLAVSAKGGGIVMDGERLVVKVSRKNHPEVFDIDNLVKQVRKLSAAHKGKRKMRDLVDFLGETEKSLEIILSNHLEAALRKYLR